MFNLLCEWADNVHGGCLPHHVRMMWDEAANTGQVHSLEKLVAVIRSCEVSLCLFYQQYAQCKAIYKDNAETILGNMDSVIFLGGRESSTISIFLLQFAETMMKAVGLTCFRQLPIIDMFPNANDIHAVVSEHVETVVLLSKVKESKVEFCNSPEERLL